MDELFVVTGAGPVGWTVAEQLAGQGKRVRILTRSASGPEPAENPGDVDVLVRFGPVRPGELFTTYFALKKGLEAILGRPVDVVSVDRLENPYVRKSVLAQREELYAA